VRNFLLFCGGLALLFSTSPTLTLVSLALIPLSIAPIFIMGKKVKQASKSSQEALSEVGSHIGETVSGIKTIQSYLCEEKEVMKFNKYLENSLSFLIKKVHFRALIISLVIAASFGTIAIVLWFGGNMVLDKRMSSGDLSSFIFYSVICATSLVAISQIMGQLQIASGAVKRLFELLDIQSPVLENSSPEKLIDKKGHEIIFQDVSFAYPSSKENLILKNLNLDILPYEKIAIVGKSGGGKSTILQLLMRFYDVNSGEIIINGQNIKNLSLEDLRGLFSYISQDCFIFSGTIFENIAYGDSELTGADVEKIVEDNQSLHFIKYMPDGLQTSVGEKGIKLSGGEKQRISIARAIVKNSPILLLDEATSALDNENESLVTEALKKLTKNRTVITVAHSLSSIINCDRIIFITNGKIMEVGSHQELIKKDGLYKKMYDHDL
jgi:ATP-binding cassette subfamily B protein